MKGNTKEENIKKAIEELQELSLVLTQYLNKPSRIKLIDITDEIGDVELRLPVLRKMFGSKAVDKRKKKKTKKLLDYLKNKKYKPV